jgi:hypothetical protein
LFKPIVVFVENFLIQYSFLSNFFSVLFTCTYYESKNKPKPISQGQLAKWKNIGLWHKKTQIQLLTKGSKFCEQILVHIYVWRLKLVRNLRMVECTKERCNSTEQKD